MSQNYSNIVVADKVMGYKEMYEQAQSMYERALSISEDISEDMNALIDRTISVYTNSEVSMIGSCAFQNCFALTTVSFPNCTTIGDFAFINCRALTTLSFPECTSINNYAFQYCSALTTVSFPKCTYIGYGAFMSCTNLFSLYFTGPSVVTLGSTNAFTGTLIDDGADLRAGSIFVPASLYASYISANNWSVYSSRFVSLTSEQIEALNN